MRKFLYVTILYILLVNFSFAQDKSLAGKTICIDPGHGGTAATDSYRVGPSGEREEWINLRVGLMLQKMLEARGAKVLMTRTTDVPISLTDRAKLAVDNQSDLFISIHHNATADSSVNFPIIYFHGNQSENLASVAFGKLLAKQLLKHLYKKEMPVSLVSDFTIFPDLGASVLRNSYGIPAVLAEASFFTNAAEEQLLKQEQHNFAEATAYTEAIAAFFDKKIPAVVAKNKLVPAIPAFKVFQEAERMTPIAKQWKQDFEEGRKQITSADTTFQRQGYELLTRSVRSFADSYVAAQCHQLRAKWLKANGRATEATQEAQRFREFYVTFP